MSMQHMITIGDVVEWLINIAATSIIATMALIVLRQLVNKDKD